MSQRGARSGYSRGPRGRFNNSGPSDRQIPAYPSSVPLWSQITPGSAVSIVLKADQPTGREVQGTVQDLLTRHDHPRGVKVRLSDGRVGRVQRMIDGNATQQVLQPAQPSLQFEVHTNTSQTPGDSQQKMRYRDIRLDDEPEEPPATNDLSAYIVKPAKQKKRKGGKAQADDAADPTPDSTCPVCGDFKGDEAAVAHHVQSHFD